MKEASVHQASILSMKMIMFAPVNFVVDRTQRLRNYVPATCGGTQNGEDHSISRTCAKLAEAENGAIGALANGLQRVADQYEMFRRDFLARPPINDGGRSYASHTGCFGRSTEGVYDIVN